MLITALAFWTRCQIERGESRLCIPKFGVSKTLNHKRCGGGDDFLKGFRHFDPHYPRACARGKTNGARVNRTIVKHLVKQLTHPVRVAYSNHSFSWASIMCFEHTGFTLSMSHVPPSFSGQIVATCSLGRSQWAHVLNFRKTCSFMAFLSGTIVKPNAINSRTFLRVFSLFNIMHVIYKRVRG